MTDGRRTCYASDMAAAKNPYTGHLLALFVGGPALVLWCLWALNLTIMVYALVMTASGAEPPR